MSFGEAGQPAATTVLYSWTTPGAHGDLVFPDNTKGTTSELNSTYSTSQYFANLANLSNNGSDVVTVTATLKMADGTTKPLGSATATITVGSGSSGYGNPIYYFMGSASGSPVNIIGGSYYIVDVSRNTVVWPDANNKGMIPVVSSTFGTLEGTVTLLGLGGVPPPVSPGDTLSVIFDCPVERNFGTGSPPTSISSSQDIHLFAPNTAKDLGVVVPQFSSNVGDTKSGAYDSVSGLGLLPILSPFRTTSGRSGDRNKQKDVFVDSVIQREQPLGPLLAPVILYLRFEGHAARFRAFLMKAPWNRFAVVGLAGLATVIGGCGGSGGGSAGSGTVVAAVVPAKVTVTLPAGYKPSGNLTVSGGLFGTVPLAGTTANIKAWNTGSELVAVLDSSGNPVLMGWIGDGNSTITARTTADALTYFAIEGFGAPNENQAALVTAIAAQSGGNTVANDLTADLAAGKNLGSTGVSYAPDLKTLASSLLGGSAPAVIRALTPVVNKSNPVEKPATVSQIIPDPTTSAGTQSGITVDTGTATDTLVATNAFRRRALLFIDRISTFDTSNPPVVTTAPLSISETELAPGVGGVNGSTISGNLSGAPGSTSSPALALSPVPPPAFGATYDVVAVGPGAANAQPSSLSPSELTDAQKFLRRTFFTDFFLPVMNRICISNTLTQIPSNSSGATTIANLMDSAADAQSAGVDAFVIANFGSAQPQMFAGDFLGANSSVLAAINGNGKIFAAVAQYYSTFLQSVGNGFTASNSNINAVAMWMATALTNVDVSNLPTALPQYSGITGSQVYSTWTVNQTTGPFVTLTPPTASITTTVGSDIANLTAAVNFGAAGQPKGSTIFYSWTTPGAHGDLVFPNSTGTTNEQNSAYDSTQYFANIVNQNNNGTDVVTVKVTLKLADGTTSTVGSASSTVTVNGTGGGNGTQYPVYALGTTTGKGATVTGGTFYVRDQTNLTVFFADINKTSQPVFSEFFIPIGGFIYFENELYPNKDASYIQAVSGDTVEVLFDCPSYAGATSISIDQDIHLYSPTGQDLGVKIPKFTSTVGDSQGFYDDNTWYVQFNIKIP